MTSHYPPPPRVPQRRRRQWLFWSLLVVVVLAVTVVLASVLGSLNSEREPVKPAFYVPFQDVQPRSKIPATAKADTTHLGAWSGQVAEATDIPARAVRAYVKAAALTERRTPHCAVDWTTIAAIGRVESKHGQHDGSVLQADGTPSQPIIGPALDGSPGLQRQPAYDGGKYTGDSQWDHAIGPMQFLPETWARWGVRASGDGAAPDPQNIDDAAATTGRYLCLNGRRMGSPSQWWGGVFKYNRSVEYGQNVFSAADAYAKAAVKVRVTNPPR
ncbi:lytic murein transglycosylase [Sciscionella marina]|uniref:lytic murein transglycosylase n=1 Tax=Sciscionella marina TaxID=508770 RepID=UPI0003732F1B|nr:lytic murein transglycosylase [Sciscionella marina]